MEIRTVSGVYLIAMKLIAHRDYRNDISDVIGILIEERDAGENITFDDIANAYKRLYRCDILKETASLKGLGATTSKHPTGLYGHRHCLPHYFCY